MAPCRPGIPPRSVEHAADAAERWRSVATLRRIRPSPRPRYPVSVSPAFSLLLGSFFTTPKGPIRKFRGEIRGEKNFIANMTTTHRFFLTICMSRYTGSKITRFPEFANLSVKMQEKNGKDRLKFTRNRNTRSPEVSRDILKDNY